MVRIVSQHPSIVQITFDDWANQASRYRPVFTTGSQLFRGTIVTKNNNTSNTVFPLPKNRHRKRLPITYSIFKMGFSFLYKKLPAVLRTWCTCRVDFIQSLLQETLFLFAKGKKINALAKLV